MHIAALNFSMKSQRKALWMALAVLLAAALASPHPACGEEISAKLLQEDFQIMRHALEEAHGGIYQYTSKTEMDRTFDRAYRKIDHPMTALEFWRLARPVVSQIKCGHTSLLFPHQMQEQLGKTIPLLPLEVRDFGDHVYVYRDFSNPGSTLEGCELLSINGVPVSRLLKEFEQVVFTGDGNTTTGRAWFIGFGRVFGIQLWARGSVSPFRVTYRDMKGKRRNVVLAGMTGPDWDRLWKERYAVPPVPNADLKFLDDGKIAVLTIRGWFHFADDDRKLTFSDFLKTSFAQIRDKGTGDLIIDVRDNGGGLEMPVIELFSFVWGQPFRVYRDVFCTARQFDFFKYESDPRPVAANLVEQRADGKFHFVKQDGVGLQQPSQPHYSGRIFALMNGASFSSSSEFLTLLHFYKRAKFIGEEPSGTCCGYTCGRFVRPILPNSRLELVFGLLTFDLDVSGYKHPERGVQPDYPVTHTISALLAGKDGDMELALSLAREKQK